VSNYCVQGVTFLYVMKIPSSAASQRDRQDIKRFKDMADDSEWNVEEDSTRDRDNSTEVDDASTVMNKLRSNDIELSSMYVDSR
jgi:hypothetical protein